MSIEAMKQWLEALTTEEYRLRQTGQSQVYSGIGFVITSLRQAIEQAEKEQQRESLGVCPKCGANECGSRDCPMNTQPQREWVGLTPHERMMCRSYDVDETIAKTEDKLKEKNT